MNTEIFKPVSIFKNKKYTVSNYGNVFNVIKNKKLSSCINTGGYPCVSLTMKPKNIFVTVHKLVAHEFIGKRPEGYQINHIDGNKINNCVENLEYVTPAQNIKHAVKNGLTPKGEKASGAKISDKKAIEIRKVYAQVKSMTRISEMFNLSRPAIRQLIYGQTWKHLGDAGKKLNIEEIVLNSKTTKLKKNDVLIIRSLGECGVNSNELAHMFNVTPTNIRCILRNKTWKFLTAQKALEQTK